MSPFVLLVGLMASPILGILVALILAQPLSRPRLRASAWLPAAAGAAVALLSAWLLRGQSMQVIVGGWFPISFTGLPLALAATSATTAVLIAWVTTYFIDTLRMPDTSPLAQHPVGSALLIPALTIVALGNNLVTLLVGLGLTDVLSLYVAFRRNLPARQALITFALNGASLVLLLVAFSVHYAGGNSLHLPLAQLPQSLAVPIALALACRLGALPFRASPTPVPDLRAAASATAGMLVLARLPSLGIARLPDWFFALLLLGAIVTLAIGALNAGDSPMPAIATAALYLAATSASLGDGGAVAAATCSWLLGVALAGASSNAARPVIARLADVARIGGAVCLAGFPLTVGFIGYAGQAAQFAARGAVGVVLVIGFTCALAGLTYLLLRVVATPLSGRAPAPLQLELDGGRGRDVAGWFVALVAVFTFGIAPALLDAGTLLDAVARNRIIGWLAWIAALAAGAGLWLSEGRWSAWAEAIRGPGTAALSLGWLYTLLGGAAARLSGPFSRVFTFLESDGALLWAMIIALLLLLIARPGGP